MRNLLNFRRVAERPSLKERAADLKAGLARLAGRSEPETTRRAMVVGSLAAAVPLPAIAMPTADPEATPHPDQALLDAEAECIRVEAAATAAEGASEDAQSAFRAALGPFPVDLLMTPWETQKFGMVCGGSAVRLPTHLVHYDDRLSADHGWTARGLQRAIDLAVTLFGQGGQTPHRIRRWRALLPSAAAYDARRDELEQQFRIRELRAERDALIKAKHRARAALHRIPASTVEGLAVHTRALAATAWYQGNTTYTALLVSAAAITGVPLRASDFDVPAWVEAWERIGGRIYWYPDSEEWAFVYPPRSGVTAEVSEAIRLLINEKSSNCAVIDRWLDDHTSDPRFARA